MTIEDLYKIAVKNDAEMKLLKITLFDNAKNKTIEIPVKEEDITFFGENLFIMM